MTAPACSRCRCAIEPTDMRCPVCGHWTGAPTNLETVRVQVLRCTSCAASIAYDAAQRAPACVYCGSVYELEEREDPLEQLDYYLPFTVSPEQAREALKQWMGTLGWFRPGDLRSASRLEELKPVWFGGWVFNATALVSWTADSNHDSKSSSWAPHAGQEGMTYENLVVPASRGLTYAEATTVATTCDLRSAQGPHQGPPGVVTEVFTVRRSAGRQRVVDAIHAESQHRVKTDVPGTRSRNVHVGVMLRNLETQRYAFPAYVLAYRYRNRLFRAVISGQDAHSVQADAPYSGWKIFGVVAAVLAALALLLIVQHYLG